MKRCLVAFLSSLTLTAFVARADDPKTEPIEVLFCAPKSPVLVRFEVNVDDQPIQKAWREFLGKMFVRWDVNGNGTLDADELRRLPKSRMLANYLRQPFIFAGSQVLTSADLGLKAEEPATLATLLRYYSINDGPINVVSNPANFAAPNSLLHDLFDRLDTNKDGKLSEAEMAAAVIALAKLDLNDDETISPVELAPQGNPYMLGMQGRGMIANNPPGTQPTLREWLPLPTGSPPATITQRLFAIYDRDQDKHLSPAEIALPADLFAKLDVHRDGRLDETELAAWRDQAPVALYRFHLSRTDAKIQVRVTWLGRDTENTTLKFPGVETSLNLPNVGINPAQFNAYNNFASLLQQPEPAKRGYLVAQDFATPQFAFYRSLFALWDRNHDGKVTMDEMKEVGSLLAEGFHLQTGVNVIDEGRPLFQLLDANRDGRLSFHELRNGWSLLKALDGNGDGALSKEEIPQQFALNFNRGPFAPGVRPGFGGMAGSSPVDPKTPLWFRKMDANGDGVVSRREFLGPADIFDRLDTDHDGFLDATEAANSRLTK